MIFVSKLSQAEFWRNERQIEGRQHTKITILKTIPFETIYNIIYLIYSNYSKYE